MDHRQQRTGQHRVVEVLGAAYGSGYAVNDRMVLTARHLLAADGSGVLPGAQVTVRVAGEQSERRATVTWVSTGVGDAALLSVDGAPWADAPDTGGVRWGSIADDGPVRCRAWGFPAAQASAWDDQEMRDIEEMHGLVKPLTPSQRYEIDVQSAAPLLTDDERSPWRGMSGAVLMDSRRRILGVVIANRMRYGGQRLQAAPAERLFTDPEFCEHVGADPSQLEDVGEEDVVVLDAAGGRPILRTIRPAGQRLDGLSDYQLLQADFQAVDFLGRQDERQDLRTWCAADGVVSLGLVAGAGGAGKTRLGIQLGRELAERGWSTGFADEQVLDAALAANKVVDVVWPTLLILDYPDRLTDRIIGWIESMGRRRFGPKLRFLLLDRVSAGDEGASTASGDLTWWSNAKRITRSDFIAQPRTVVHLRSGGLTEVDRSQHLESARRAFGGGNADLSGLDLTDDAYRNPLKVHVAVLLAIRGERYSTAAEVMSRFLDREMHLWLQLRTKHGIANVSPSLARQVVALTTLTRPEIDAVPRLLSAIPDLADPADTGGLLRPNVRNWLVELFGAGSRISAIEPDLLAEQLLDTTARLDEIVVSIYRHEASTAEHVATMLEALSLAAGGRQRVRDVLRLFLTECLGSLAAQAAEEPDGRLPGLIEIALAQFSDDDKALAAAAVHIRRVPHPQDSYRQLMSRLARLSLAWCAAQPWNVQIGPVRADALTDMAAEAAIAGQRTEATGLAAAALRTCRSLGADESRRLARAWYNLGTCHANSGDLSGAREALSAAAAAFRRTVDERTDVLIERSETLVNLGSCLADLGDQAGALEAGVEAIEFRIGRDYAGNVLEPLAEPLALLARRLHERPGTGASLGAGQPFRPMCWSEPEHHKWGSSHSLALVALAARLSAGLADRVALHIRVLPIEEAQREAAALSDALYGLTRFNLSDPVSQIPLRESVELRRWFVTDDLSRAEFAKYLGKIAGELSDADDSDSALAYANDSIAEFERVSRDFFASYEGDFAKAVLVKVGTLMQSGLIDPFQFIHGGLSQSMAAELDEADRLLRKLPETAENGPALAEVSAMRGIHLLLTGDVGAASEVLARAEERYAEIEGDDAESADGWVFMHVLVELVAGRQPYGWLTSLSDAELQALDPEALPFLDQAMLSESEEMDDLLGQVAGLLALGGRTDIARNFASQAVALGRFWMRFEQDSDLQERTEMRLSLSQALSILAETSQAVPHDALRYAREAMDVIADVPDGEELLPLVRGLAGLALTRASLTVDPQLDVVGIAENATADLTRSMQSLSELDERGSFVNSASVSAMRAEALVLLSNTYLAVNRPAEAGARALVARDLLLQLPQTRPIVALVVATHLVEGQAELTAGRYASALAAFDRVIAAYEVVDLAPASPIGLAEAAHLTAVCLQELGQPEEALRNSRLAAQLWQSPEWIQLAAPTRIAANLVVQAVALSALGDLDEAYEVSRLAVATARDTPHAAAGLVNALRVRGSCAAALRRFPEAVSLLGEAMTVAGRAAGDGQEIAPLVLGLVKLAYGNCQTELGELAAALVAFLGAAEILREIPGQTLVLAGTLVLAAQCHRGLDHNATGLPLLLEAVGRCRELIVDQDSATGLADIFTGALWDLIVCQLTEDDTVAADAAAIEGIDFVRRWGLVQQAEVTEATLHYADMLVYHFGLLVEYGRDVEALPFCMEAIGILRTLAGVNPEAFVPAYLNALAGQIQLLGQLGRHADAAAAENEYARWAPR